MTCALAAPTHNVTPHIATNSRFLMDIRTSGIAHVREQLIRNCRYVKLALCEIAAMHNRECGDGLVAISRQESARAKAYHQLTDVISERPQWWHILR
jgi:hypothetical protein